MQQISNNSSLYCFAIKVDGDETDFPPADLNRVTKMQWIPRFLALLEMADIKIGQRMVDKSMHGTIGAVHILVNHPRNEV